MKRSLLEGVAAGATRSVRDTFWRHAAPNRDAFVGGFEGRWGREFPVIYLARPENAAVAEAYRHLVEDAQTPAHAVGPRTLYTVRVNVAKVLDLTDAQARESAGLVDEDLASPVGDYQACQEVAAAAHQLGRHGILAPAAHGLGHTLALFAHLLEPGERPVVVQQERWEQLPPDPRSNAGRLRVVGRGE